VTESAHTIEEALSIPIPVSDRLVLDDARRLTGPGLMWDRPGAVLDVFADGIANERIIAHWRPAVRRVLNAIGWAQEHFIERPFEGGVSLAISAPADQLYSAVYAAQTAWHFCASELLDREPGDFVVMIAALKSVMAREANPALIALLDAARARGLDALVDDDFLSVGHGKTSLVWPVMELPDPGAVDWAGVANLPLALITGTNGKTTTTRLCCAIARAAGKVAGLTSTEMVRVGDDILDRGDYSGPGGARMLLRDKRLEMAFLEVARGGILRRGLPVLQARAALVTNIAADHLGQFGINTVDELAEVKLAVHRSVGRDGILVLNADDPYLVAHSVTIEAHVWWFSLDPGTAQIVAARAGGRPCAWLEGAELIFFDGASSSAVIDIADIPIAMAGAARYNLLNALGAICLARALGLELDAIRDGLHGFRNNPADNPGRCNEFAVNGARVFVDFAHNPHSIAAVTATMGAIAATRRFVMLGHAGDRSDSDIRDATVSALAMRPDVIVATDLPQYLRGRQPGEVSGLIAKVCEVSGLAPDQILVSSSPAAGCRQIIERLQPGDLALLLVLSERDEIFAMLSASAVPPH
jgi:cyanophycin synthetase